MTKPREKTREELQAEIEDGKKKIRSEKGLILRKKVAFFGEKKSKKYS